DERLRRTCHVLEREPARSRLLTPAGPLGEGGERRTTLFARKDREEGEQRHQDEDRQQELHDRSQRGLAGLTVDRGRDAGGLELVEQRARVGVRVRIGGPQSLP